MIDMEFCHKCEGELNPHTSYKVTDGRGRSMGELCEPCAEADFDSYQESMVG